MDHEDREHKRTEVRMNIWIFLPVKSTSTQKILPEIKDTFIWKDETITHVHILSDRAANAWEKILME